MSISLGKLALVIGLAAPLMLGGCSDTHSSDGWASLGMGYEGRGGIEAFEAPQPAIIEELAGVADVAVVGTLVDVRSVSDPKIDEDITPVAGLAVRVETASNSALVGTEINVLTARDPQGHVGDVADELVGTQAFFLLQESVVDGYYDKFSSRAIIVDTGSALEVAGNVDAPHFIEDAEDSLDGLFDSIVAEVATDQT